MTHILHIVSHNTIQGIYKNLNSWFVLSVSFSSLWHILFMSIHREGRLLCVILFTY